jgi:hypothetical protein
MIDGEFMDGKKRKHFLCIGRASSLRATVNIMKNRSRVKKRIPKITSTAGANERGSACPLKTGEILKKRENPRRFFPPGAFSLHLHSTAF